MSNPSPYIVTVSEDGLYTKVEMDAHYVTDEQAETIRKYIKTLETENAKLQDENARLRSCLSDDAENARMIMGENAKLRECLQDLAEHIREDDGFGLDYGWMLDRICELGIEVDDA